MQIIRGARLVTFGRLSGDFADIVIDDDKIAAVLPPGEAKSENAKIIDGTGKLLIPGLVNTHMHAHGNLSKGSGDRWTLELLLHHAPWTGGRRTFEHHYLSAVIGAAEMISKGCTTTYDLFGEFPLPTVEGLTAVGQAYEDAGMRAVIAPMMADRTFYQAIPGLLDALPEPMRAKMAAITASPYHATLAACATVLGKWKFSRERVRAALAPTIPHHCSDDFMIGCRDLARDHKIGLHMHVGESKVQAAVADQWYGRTLAGHLAKLGMFGPGFTAAHAIWLDDDDMDRLADHGVSVAHNPSSNMHLGSGIAAIRQMLDRKITVGIGTDGASSSDNLNMFEAMRASTLVSRLRSLDTSQWLSVEEAFTAATVGGAKALGMADLVGQIAPGFKADIVFLDLQSMNYVPLNNALNQIIHCEDGTGVDSVMIDGRFVYASRKHVTVNPATIAGQAAEAVNLLKQLNSEARALAEKLDPYVNRFCAGIAARPYPIERLAPSR